MAASSAKRDAILEQLLVSAERKWGYNSLVRLGSSPAVSNIPVISTGFPEFDSALGIGGIPRGRITQFFGSPSSGKATLAVKLISMGQMDNGVAAYVDLGRNFDPVYANQVGVDLNRLLIVHSENLADALKTTVSLVCSKELDLIIFDSANFQLSQAKEDTSRPALMSKALRSLAGLVDKSNLALVFIDEIPFTAKDPSTSDLAMRFYSSIRVSVSRKSWLNRGADIIGWLAKIIVVKNKLAAPMGTASVEIVYENRLCIA